jgi:hypothetical protein
MRVVMKALSIRQPWPHLVVTGRKRIENRTWRTAYRGPLLVHAGSQWHGEPIDAIEKRHRITIPRDIPLGGIIGIVDLVDIVERSEDPYFVGPYGWVLRNARSLLGLFETLMDPFPLA